MVGAGRDCGMGGGRLALFRNLLHGKEKPFHDIEPSEEHCPGGRRVTVKVYIQ